MSDEEKSRSSADRLRSLILAAYNTLDKPMTGGKTLGQTSLADGASTIARELGFLGYADFSFNYFDLIRSIERDVAFLRYRRESVRESTLKRLQHIRSAFDAKNFLRSVEVVFRDNFGSRNLEALEDISDRLEDQGFIECDLETLQEALSTAKELTDEAYETGRLSEKAALIIKAYTDHLRSITDTYQTLGERDFWQSYKVLFATFVQLHDSIYETDEEKKSGAEGLKKMLNILVTGSSLTANVITISPAVIQYLT